MDYKKEIIKILEDEAVLLDEGYGTTGITEDEHEKIAERIVKLFAIPDVSNSLLSLDGKTIPATFHVSKFEPKIDIDLSNDC